MSVGISAAVGGGLLAAAGGIGGALIAKGGMGDAANSQQASAQAQLAASQQALNAQIAERQRVEQRGIELGQQVGAMTPGEYNSISSMLSDKQTAITSSLQSVQAQQARLDSLDPQVKASGQNLLDLLNGKSAAVLAPMQQLMDRQRTQLTNQLASTMGPGWATSSAGIEAMTKFDQNAALTIGQTQMQAVMQVAGAYSNLFGQGQAGAAQITSAIGDIYSRANLVDQSVLQANEVQANRLANATMSGFRQTGVDYTGTVPFAGAGSVGGILGGQSTGQLGGAIGQTAGNVGGQIAGYGTLSSLLNNPNSGTTTGAAPLSSQIGSMSILPAYNGGIPSFSQNLTGSATPNLGVSASLTTGQVIQPQ